MADTKLNCIATRDFRNTHPKIIQIEDALHPDHVHKGAKFTLDTKTDSNLIALLNATGSIIDAADEESVKRLNRELAEDRKRAENDAKLAAAAAKAAK